MTGRSPPDHTFCGHRSGRGRGARLNRPRRSPHGRAGRMTRAELVVFLRRYRLAVQASIAAGGAPQAAVVGFGVSDACEIVFDTLTTTRKYRNLIADPRI